MPIDRYKQLVLATTGLIAYWRLGESSGTSAADSSGNGNTGTYTNGPTLGVSGAIVSSTDTGITLDGSNDHVVSSTTAPFALNALSVEAWVWTSSPTSGGFRMFVSASNSFGASGAWDLGITDTGYPYFGGWTSGGSDAGTAVSSDVLPSSQWVHLVGTRDGSNVKIYLNGVEKGSGAVAGTLNTPGQPCRIGCRNPAGPLPSFFPGRMDEVCVTSATLTASEVLARYNAGVAAAVGENSAFVGDGSSLLGD